MLVVAGDAFRKGRRSGRECGNNSKWWLNVHVLKCFVIE